MHHYSNYLVFSRLTVLTVIFYIALSGKVTFATSGEQIPTRDESFPPNKTMNLNEYLYKSSIEKNPLIIYKEIDSSFSPKYLSKDTNNYANEHYLIGDGEIYNIIKIPDGKTDYWAIGISVLALLSSVLVPWLLHRKQKKDAINEGFWLREVIFPKINGLMFDFCNELKASFELDITEFAKKYEDVVSMKMGELRDTFSMLNCFPNMQASIDILDQICDELDNDVDTHQTEVKKIRVDDVSRFNTKMLSRMLDVHRNI